MITHLFFDFDGVIANSTPAQLASWNEMLEYFNKGMRVDEDFLRKNWQGDAERFYKHYLGFTDEEYRTQIIRWRALAEHKPAQPLTPGIKNILKTLAKKYTLVVVSSNYREHIIPTLEAEDIIKYFRAVYGPTEAGGASKPHPDAFLIPMKDLGIKRENVLALGDSVGDIICAKFAGVRSIACTWGWNSSEILAAAEPDHIAEKPEELLALL